MLGSLRGNWKLQGIRGLFCHCVMLAQSHSEAAFSWRNFLVLCSSSCPQGPLPPTPPSPSQPRKSRTNKRERNYDQQRKKTVNGIKQSKALSRPRALSHNKCVAQMSEGLGHSLTTQTGSQGGKTFCPHLRHGR